MIFFSMDQIYEVAIEFQLTLGTENLEVSDTASMLCKNLNQGIPLPRCGVTQQQRPVADMEAVGKVVAQQKAAFFAKNKDSIAEGVISNVKKREERELAKERPGSR